MLRDDIVDHLKENKLSQHGFMKNKSCLTNLLQFLETVTDYHDYINKGYQGDVIYLNSQKAFDKVPHLRFKRKLTA